MRLSFSGFLCGSQNMNRRLDYVSHNGEVREEVKVLKDGAHFQSEIPDATFVISGGNSGLEFYMTASDRSAIDCFEAVETTQKSCLATARCAYAAEDRVLGNFETDSLKNFVVAKSLAQVCNLNHAATSASSTLSVAPFLSRCSSPRATWAIGKLIAR